uniref:Uncharacterized protein n=1 Tax=Anguilla anguilla TaxID=7936 RepID=A0A0E9WQD1_ANGAN
MVGYMGKLAIPHWLFLFLAIRMNPLSPQAVPQLFFTSQKSFPLSVPYPTTSTA